MGESTEHGYFLKPEAGEGLSAADQGANMDALDAKLHEIEQTIASLSTCKDFGFGCPYPIGDVLMRQSDDDPHEDWPGTTWTEIGQGHVPIGANSTYATGSSGEPTHKHTTGNFTLGTNHIPGHTHGSKSLVGRMGVRRTSNNVDVAMYATGDAIINGIVSRTEVSWSGGHWGLADAVWVTNPKADGIVINATHEHTSVGGGQAHNHGDTGTATAIPPWFGVRFWKRTA